MKGKKELCSQGTGVDASTTHMSHQFQKLKTLHDIKLKNKQPPPPPQRSAFQEEECGEAGVLVTHFCTNLEIS